MTAYHTILVDTDGSDRSYRVIDWNVTGLMESELPGRKNLSHAPSIEVPARVA